MQSFSKLLLPILMLLAAGCLQGESQPVAAKAVPPSPPLPAAPALDTAGYDARCLALSNGDTTGKWHPKAPYPLPGAILPFKRIVAYYGNFYSKRMGILGELPEEEMLEKLQSEVEKWQRADTLTPVQPALHYIAVTAQENPGAGGKYRLRMPFKEIDKALEIAKKVDALVFLDIQIGTSTLQAEIPELEKYLKMPHVHLGIDPEFSMKTGARPGTKIGSVSAEDVNYAAGWLAALVKRDSLPPKILIVHRFTKAMVKNSKDIKPLPEVQIVMDMDGWGGPAKKRSTYRQVAFREPVQFTGFKIFYKHDVKKIKPEMQPADVLELVPKPIYIQYQ